MPIWTGGRERPTRTVSLRRVRSGDVRILIAEDDATSRVIAEAALKNLGHTCHAVPDGARAWKTFRTFAPDVVISDWIMPDMSGLELCRRIRTHQSESYSYFIMVSSRGAVEDIFEGMRAGADDYLIKPVRPEDLEARLISAARVSARHQDLAPRRDELERLNRELSAMASRDPLTGLGNRRALEEDLRTLEARVRRYGHRYCMSLIDIDHFKSFNDEHGHRAGDHALQAVAEQLKKQARSGDTVYRYGGDELLCIFPEQSLSTSNVAVERMRISVEMLGISHAGNPGGVVTLSAGLAMMDPGQFRSVGEVLDEADKALYRAKHLGRNRVELVGIADPVPVPGRR
jgi:two-component system cell cycle response regulator